MSRLRYRLARWLIGPFVTIPARDGVWIVSRMGPATTTLEADEFNLDMSRNLVLRQFGDVPDFATYGISNSNGTFSGKVKS